MNRNKNIKMRTIKEKEGYTCKTCGCDGNHCLDLFELCFVGAETGKQARLVICDDCVETLFSKTLRATTYVNGRLKSQRDIAISANRRNRNFKETFGEFEKLPINPPDNK